jgi:hypothetical protein
MKITGNNILLAFLAVVLLLVGVVSAVDYCTPPGTVNTTVDISGNWTNFTFTTDACPLCIDWGFGVTCTGDCPLGNYTRGFGGDTNVRINQSFTLDDGKSTPRELWILSGLIGLFLFLVSMMGVTSKGNLERNIIVSVMAWIPIGFCAYASFAINELVSFGVTSAMVVSGNVSNISEYVLLENHVLSSNPVVGILMFVFLVVAIVNTLRLIALHRMFQGEQQ